MDFPKDRTWLVRCSLDHMDLGKTCLRIRQCGWRDPALALILGGAAGGLMGEDSTLLSLNAGPGRRSCLAAPHVVKIRGGRTHAVALANVQAVRQELPFQGPNAHFVLYQLMISGHD
jgi:hypothetical protein